MSDKSSDLEYVSNALRKAEGTSVGYPIIYCLWGVIIFVGYAVEEYLIQHISLYWSIAAPAGWLLSAWIGARSDINRGQADKALGMQYMWHFMLMMVFIFAAGFTGKYDSILLLISIGYAMAGLYLDKLMHLVAATTLLAYFGIYAGVISSGLFVGGILAFGCFTAAYATAKANRNAKQTA